MLSCLDGTTDEQPDIETRLSGNLKAVTRQHDELHLWAQCFASCSKSLQEHPPNRGEGWRQGEPGTLAKGRGGMMES